MIGLQKLIAQLKQKSNSAKAKLLSRYFKTAPGEYGHGDIFLGITVPELRKIAIKFNNCPLSDIDKLLKSKIHEHRFVGLIILCNKYQKSDQKQQNQIYKFYLRHTRYINNWDLVDTSAHVIIGQYLWDKNKKDIYKLARSKNLWKKRIAIIATFYFIKNNKFDDSLAIARILLDDRHDLIHKAVGWMLREIGNRSKSTEIKFLKKYYQKMPRVMLRYAIEKFPANEKRKFS